MSRRAILARLTKEEQESEQKWRTVGTIRRYILLILTLAQTVVATWYMKTISPYQGWALINPMDMVGQDLWVSLCSFCLICCKPVS
ncbi:hypothetical protein ACLB1T_24665 [Escherichia coli]